MTRTIDDQARAAREALRTHDELRRVEAAGDAFTLDPDELPVDPAGWWDWHDEQYRPALEEWQTAMALLALALGDQFPGWHPHNWRPVCEQILIRDQVADALADAESASRAAVDAIGGEQHAVRAEQLRADGLTERQIARRLRVRPAKVRTWFRVRDRLVLLTAVGHDVSQVDQLACDAPAGSGAR